MQHCRAGDLPGISGAHIGGWGLVYYGYDLRESNRLAAVYVGYDPQGCEAGPPYQGATDEVGVWAYKVFR